MNMRDSWSAMSSMSEYGIRSLQVERLEHRKRVVAKRVRGSARLDKEANARSRTQPRGIQRYNSLNEATDSDPTQP